MNILLIGSGGREHALAWKMAQSPLVDMVHSTPGNPGMDDIGPCFDVAVTDIQKLVQLTLQVEPDLIVIGPAGGPAGKLESLLQGAHGAIWRTHGGLWRVHRSSAGEILSAHPRSALRAEGRWPRRWQGRRDRRDAGPGRCRDRRDAVRQVRRRVGHAGDRGIHAWRGSQHLRDYRRHGRDLFACRAGPQARG